MLLWKSRSPLSVVPAGSVQPSFVLDSLVQPWGGFRSASARSSEVSSSARSLEVSSSAHFSEVLSCTSSSKIHTLPPAPTSSTAVVWQQPRSPSAPYLYGVSAVGLPSSSVAGAEVSLTSASLALTPPQPVDPEAPPRLLALSPPPSPIDPPAPPGSLTPPALPWSGVDPPSPLDSSPLAAHHRSNPPAPLGSFLPSAPPGSSVAPACISGVPSPPPEPSAPPWPPGSSASPWLVGSPSRAPPPAAPPPLFGPLESAAIPPPSVGSTMGWHGCGLGLAVRLLLRVSPVSSLAPPSFVTSLVSVCRPPLPIWCFYGVRMHLPGEGDMSGLWTVLCVFCSLCVPCDPVSRPPWLLIWFQVCLIVFPNYPVFKSSSLSVCVCQVYFVMCVSPAGSCMYHPGFDYIKSCWTLFLASSLLPAQSVTQGVHRVDNICNNQLNLIGVSHFVPQTH